MGMSLLGGSGNFVELYSIPEGTVTITSTAGDKPFTNTIAIPSDLVGTVKEAYIDIILNHIQNDFAGANKIAGLQYIKVDNAAVGGWVTCTSVSANTLYLSAQGVLPPQIVCGTVDIKAKAEKGETLNFKWFNADADQNNIVIRNLIVRLRLIMG